MRVPTEDELAAIAAAYLAVQREQIAPKLPVSRWRLAARALAPSEKRRLRWRDAGRVR